MVGRVEDGGAQVRRLKAELQRRSLKAEHQRSDANGVQA